MKEHRNSSTVTVFGAANLDVIARTGAPPVMGASNPGTIQTAVGGVGFNVAKILAQLGHTVRLATRIGKDPSGQAVGQAIESAGLDSRQVTVSNDKPTAVYHALLDHRGDLILGLAAMEIYDTLAASALVETTEAAQTDRFWVLDANLPTDAIGYLLDRANEFAIDTVALPVSPAKAARLRPHLDKASLVIANRREAGVLAGFDAGCAEIAATLAKRHRLAAVITDGAAALAVDDGTAKGAFQPFSGPIASVNGAGDALAAGLLHGVIGGLPLFQSIAPGLAAASLTLACPESVPDTLTIAAINRRIAAEKTS